MAIAEHYELIDCLYDGRIVTVFRGRDRKNGDRVILKIAKPGTNATRLRSEHAILEGLRIPGVVQARRIEERGSEIVLVLEDLGGDTLGKRLAQGAMSLTDALRIGAEIADALAQIHRCRVIHKDINPNNILLGADGHAHIFDFDLSTRLPREVQSIEAMNRLSGTLPYISPEQTGRMNRAIDYRTDLYSLGVTLYTMLVGQVPFPSRDPAELIHCHIAKHATPLSEVDPNIPAPVSDIVRRLLEKSAEERYQSASGLRADLEECRRSLEQDGRVEPFPLGRADISERFQIPQKLYGRQREISALEEAFERVRQGRSEIMLTAGSSGIGKSSVIHELYRSLVQSRGYLVSGKFDELKRDIPYTALLEALSELIRTLLTETNEQLAILRDRILGAAKGAGRILTDVLPDLARIIGPQPPLPELSAAEGRTRFRLVFESFVRVFTQDGQPLVMFLDDLQWADAATLDILPSLLGDGKAGALLVIGAYRDNEVSATHPLVSAVAAIEQAGCRSTRITLGPIGVEDVCQIVEDTLFIPPRQALPLAELVWRRTGGNPLFVSELLTTLHRNGLIELDLEHRRWSFALAQIEQAETTDNIGQLMSARAATLATGTQEILKLAAVLGSRFDLGTLAIVAERSPDETRAALEEALEEGLVLASSQATHDMFRFLHDRVQQAVYASIPEEVRLDLHYRAGRLLLGNQPEDDNDDWLFTLLHHLNLAGARVIAPEERIDLARRNLAAAKRATASGAFSSASNHYATGIRFLPPEAWESHHELMFAMHYGLAECAYASSDHAAVGRLFDLLLERSRTDIERVKLYELMTTFHLHLARYHEAIGPALKALALLGIKLDPEPKPPLVLLELFRTKRALRGRSPSELRHLPKAEDPQVELTHRMLIVTSMVAFFTNTPLYGILTLKTVQVSLERGYSIYTAESFTFFGLMLIALFGSYAEGNEFGRLSLDLLERFPDTAAESRVKNSYGYFMHPWRNPARGAFRYLEAAYHSSLLSGEMLVAGYTLFNSALLLAITGTPLDTLRDTCDRSLEFARKIKHDFAEKILLSLRHATLALQGKTRAPGSYDTEDFDEARYVAQMMGKTSQMDLAHYWLFKVMVLHLLGRHDEILGSPEVFRKAIRKEMEHSPLPVLVDHHYYDALVLAALAERHRGVARQRELLSMRTHLRRLKQWADNAPMNFRHKYLIVGAELSRLSGDPHRALGQYQEAIVLARENGFLQDEAIALELVSRAYRSCGLEDEAITYLARSRQAYERWGALAKVALLDAAYPGLAARAMHAERTASGGGGSVTTTNSTSQSVDAPSMVKASQALSGEVSLDKLILRLMTIVAENAGAERGALVLLQQGSLLVVAEFSAREGARRPERSVPLAESTNLSQRIVNYVFRTQESVILGDATREGDFTTDAYVTRRAPKAVMCTPLLQKGEVAGALYLENNLVAGAFTKERAELLNVLCGQMAISIDNAYLYADLEKKVTERTRALKEAQARLVQLEKEATEIQMAGGFAHEMRNALAGAKIMLTAVCRESETNPWTASADNSAKLLDLLSRIQGQVPKDVAASIADVISQVNRTEKKIDSVLHGVDRSLVRGLRITSQILNYAEVGRNQPGVDSISIATLVSSIVQDSQDDFKAHSIDVDVDISGDCTIVGNELHFHSMVKNLVLNARDAVLAVEDGERPRKISIRAVERPTQIVLSVEDTGVGIPADLHEKIFQPFFSTKPHTGAGLGLGMTKKLARLYDGVVELTSLPKQGTTFRVVIPKSRDDASAAT